MALLTPAQRAEIRATPAGTQRMELRQSMRRAALLLKFPDTDGVPPWIVVSGQLLEKLGKALLQALGNLAMEGVRNAVTSGLSGGRAKHDAAVSHVMQGAPDVAADVAAELVWTAFKTLSNEDDQNE